MEELSASIEMSKLAGAAMGRSDLLDSVSLLRLRSENKTDSREVAIVVVVLTGNLEGKLSVVYNKAEIWKISARTLAITLSYVSNRGHSIKSVIWCFSVAR